MNKLIGIGFLAALAGPVVAQNIGINSNGATPDASALLDIDVSALPANAKRLSEQGLDPTHSTPDALGSTVANELTKWARVVKAANVTIN